MKLSYDREKDILTIETSEEPIDHAEEIGPIILHLTKDNKPVLLEILDASEFLSEVSKVTMRSEKGEPVEIPL